MMIDRYLKSLYVLLLVSFLTACATSPMGRTQLAFLPDAELDSMGLQAFENLKKEKPISRNARETEFVRCITSAIAREVGGE